MEQNFNKLTPAEDERLALLIEEASEVIHIACKILRHGYESYNPDGDPEKNNRHLLEEELAQLITIMISMEQVGDTSEQRILHLLDEISLKNTVRYLHHNKKSEDAKDIGVIKGI